MNILKLIKSIFGWILILLQLWWKSYPYCFYFPIFSWVYKHPSRVAFLQGVNARTHVIRRSAMPFSNWQLTLNLKCLKYLLHWNIFFFPIILCWYSKLRFWLNNASDRAFLYLFKFDLMTRQNSNNRFRWSEERIVHFWGLT